MLTKQEWVKKFVVRWQGIKNCDTHTVEGGYLWVRNNDGSITGLGGRGVRCRKEAIDQNYQIYVETQKAAAGGERYPHVVSAFAVDA